MCVDLQLIYIREYSVKKGTAITNLKVLPQIIKTEGENIMNDVV
jgi:hypothetical protein